ncbi:hypothetical protein [Methylobacterium radiodurans]|uniref:hypothetical protein n=1 Tax=Methylobacterium radiodurans TaxID=2202828 RepID=UPI0013A578B4|nr:hypothetical protein [Methylobacterium radiodurans]
MAEDIHPFTRDVPEAMLHDLRRLLGWTRWPDRRTCDIMLSGMTMGCADLDAPEKTPVSERKPVDAVARLHE